MICYGFGEAIDWEAVGAIGSVAMVPLTAVPLWLLLQEKKKARLKEIEDEFKILIKGIRKSAPIFGTDDYNNLILRDAFNRGLPKNRIALLIIEELTKSHFTAEEATEEVTSIFARFRLMEQSRSTPRKKIYDRLLAVIRLRR